MFVDLVGSVVSACGSYWWFGLGVLLVRVVGVVVGLLFVVVLFVSAVVVCWLVWWFNSVDNRLFYLRLVVV